MKELRYKGQRTDNGEWVYGTPYVDSEGKVFILPEDNKAIPYHYGYKGVSDSRHGTSLLLEIPAHEVKEETVLTDNTQ
jgi:hypothetical protein